MSTIKIEDVCIWPKHIDRNDSLRDQLLALAEGQIVILSIGGTSGAFIKMKQGNNPQPTPGLKPACDTTRDWWKSVYEAKKGETAEIQLVAQ